jgi:hypothetical protein
MGLASKLTPIYTQCGAVRPTHARTAPPPFFAENNGINLRKNCDEWIGATYRLARGRNSAFMDSCQLIRKETKMDVVHLNQRSNSCGVSAGEGVEAQAAIAPPSPACEIPP